MLRLIRPWHPPPPNSTSSPRSGPRSETTSRTMTRRMRRRFVCLADRARLPEGPGSSCRRRSQLATGRQRRHRSSRVPTRRARVVRTVVKSRTGAARENSQSARTFGSVGGKSLRSIRESDPVRRRKGTEFGDQERRNLGLRRHVTGIGATRRGENRAKGRSCARCLRVTTRRRRRIPPRL